jgi:hypothetical protein
MIQTQLVDIKFDASVTTKTDDKNTLYTSFTEMKNSRTDLLSAVRPRGGVTESILSSPTQTGLSGAGFGVAANSQYEIHLNKGSAWRITDASESVSGTELRGSVSRQALGDSSQVKVSADTSGTTICTAWADGNLSDGGSRLCVQLQTLAGQVIVQESVRLPAEIISQLAVLYVGTTYYIVLTTETSGNTWYAYRVSTDETGALTSVTWASAPAAASVVWDAATDGTAVYLCYATSGSADMTLSRTVPAGSTWPSPATSVTVTSSFGTAVTAVSLNDTTGFQSTTLGLVAAGASNGFLRFYNSSLSQIGASVAAFSISGTPDNCWLAQRNASIVAFGFTEASFSPYICRHQRYYYNLPTVTSSRDPDTNYQFTLAAAPWYQDDQLMFLTDTFTASTYGSQMIANAILTTAQMDPAFALGISKNLGYENGYQPVLPKPLYIGNTIVIPACFVGSVESLALIPPADDTITSTFIDAAIQASLITIDLSKYPDKFLDGSNRQGVLIGSVPRHVASYRQIASPWPEPAITNEAGRLEVNTLPSTTFSGTVSCVFAKVLTFPDGTVYRLYGQIYTALFSHSAFEYTLTSDDFSTPGWPSSAKKTIEFYKTTENGTIFYLAATHIQAGNTIDDVLDDVLVGNRLADINGNELYPETAPGVRAITAWKDRLVVLGADSGTVLKFDKPSNTPQGTYFADGLELDVGTEGGDVTALGSMDSALYIFKRNLIMTCYGDPPGATGEGGSLSVPTVIKQGIGTEDPRSVILTPLGLMFNSQKGFYLIMRNQELQFVGTGPYSDRQVVLTGSAIDEDQTEVYFSYADGSIWAYNYGTSQWYKWLVADTLRGISTGSGTLVGCTDFGYLEYSQSATVDTREGVGTRQIPQTYTTGWLRTNSIRGYQRIKRAYFTGAVAGDTDLQLDVYTDYQATPVQTFNFTLTAVDPLNLDLHLKVQKCEAMRFKFTTTKAMLTLSGGTLEFGVKSGTDMSRTSATNKN